MGNVLLSIQNKKGGVPNASILYEVPCQKGNERRQGHNDEEWQAGDPGCVPHMRNQDVPNREELRLISCKPGLLWAGCSHEGTSSLFVVCRVLWTNVD